MQSSNESDDDDEDDEYDRVSTPPPEPEPVDTTSMRRVCIGLLVATIAFLPVYSPFRLLYGPVFRWLQIRTFYGDVFFVTLYEWVRAACMLLIIWWDGAPLGVFGLKKPAWSMDTVTAVLAFVAHRAFCWMAVDLMISFLTSLNYKIPARHSSLRFNEPDHSCTGMLVLLILSLSIGFSEELITRGYLIPRLERIVKSKLWAIVISSAFFAGWHISNGIISVWSAFWAGMIYGIVFVWTRRLWPTIFTHALYDFLAYLTPRLG
jgi:membrane protease YdiL (CAAX protease family)